MRQTRRLRRQRELPARHAAGQLLRYLLRLFGGHLRRGSRRNGRQQCACSLRTRCGLIQHLIQLLGAQRRRGPCRHLRHGRTADRGRRQGHWTGRRASRLRWPGRHGRRLRGLAIPPGCSQAKPQDQHHRQPTPQPGTGTTGCPVALHAGRATRQPSRRLAARNRRRGPTGIQVAQHPVDDAHARSSGCPASNSYSGWVSCHAVSREASRACGLPVLRWARRARRRCHQESGTCTPGVSAAAMRT